MYESLTRMSVSCVRSPYMYECLVEYFGVLPPFEDRVPSCHTPQRLTPAVEAPPPLPQPWKTDAGGCQCHAGSSSRSPSETSTSSKRLHEVVQVGPCRRTIHTVPTPRANCNKWQSRVFMIATCGSRSGFHDPWRCVPCTSVLRHGPARISLM